MAWLMFNNHFRDRRDSLHVLIMQIHAPHSLLSHVDAYAAASAIRCQPALLFSFSFCISITTGVNFNGRTAFYCRINLGMVSIDEQET